MKVFNPDILITYRSKIADRQQRIHFFKFNVSFLITLLAALEFFSAQIFIYYVGWTPAPNPTLPHACSLLSPVNYIL
jgi:hypothetical protein